MSLPIITVPTYEVELPISKERVTIRQYTGKEEKLLLMALESKDPTEKTNLLFQVIRNVTLGSLIPENTSIQDLIYLTLKVKAASKGEKIDLWVTCKNKVEGEVCNHRNEVQADLNDLRLSSEKLPNDKIKLSEDVGIKLQPPSGKFLGNIIQGNSISVISDDLLVDIVNYIWDDETIHYKESISRTELLEFLEGLPSTALEQIVQYVETLPQIVLPVAYVCGKCSKEDTFNLSSRDLENFLN